MKGRGEGERGRGKGFEADTLCAQDFRSCCQSQRFVLNVTLLV